MSAMFSDSPACRVQKIDDHLYCLLEVNLVCMYLILGSEKAMLLDTGYGYTDYRPLIRAITDLPLVVVNTHGHPDHALGSYLFKDVYMAEEDYENLCCHCNPVLKKASLEFRYQIFPECRGLIEEEAYCQTDFSDTRFHFIQEGEIFDLGGGQLMEIYSMPGHSDGSVCVLDRKNRRFFSGDIITCNNIWCFTDPKENSFEKMLYSYEKAKKLSGFYDEIYSAHGKNPIAVSILDELIGCIYDIRDHRERDPLFCSKLADTVTNLPKYSHQYKSVLMIYTEETLKTLPYHS